MKLIKQSYEILEQSSGLEGVYKQIELAGRTCYKSEDKITEDSAKRFVDKMIKLGHTSMLEHGTVYLKLEGAILDPEDYEVVYGNYLVHDYIYNPYSKVVIKDIGNEMSNIYVTTNLRVLYENNLMRDLNFLCEPTKYHEKRITVKWHIDRVAGESFLRHRVFSFARESTRYCNYSKDKFGNELTFILPNWIEESNLPNYNLVEIDDDGPFIAEYFYKGDGSPLSTPSAERDFYVSLEVAEASYFSLLDKGWQPQQARQVLPFSIYSPLVMTGFVSDWKHFFSLRTPKSAHPQARELAIPLEEEMVKRNYLNN